MRPGPHPWAENDAYVAGPDIGHGTKTSPLTVHKEDGYYRERKPAPDIINWQLNRSALVQRFAAKLFASNWTLEDSVNAPAGGETLGASCVMTDATSGLVTSLFFYDDMGPGNVVERVGRDGRNFYVPSSSPVAGIPGPAAALDADSDGAGNRIVVCSAPPITDRVFYSAGYGAGAWALSTIAAAPALDWISVGCDRAANEILIGDSGAGGTAAPAVYLSSDGGANFAAVATFPPLAIWEQVFFIGHTNHPAGALGPDDSGNESWLILTTTRALVSADGVTWSNQLHGFSAAATRKCAAYDRVTRRWVAVIGAGGTFYSSDNGATWTAGATLPIYAGTAPQIVCDGYGTLVIGNIGTRIWISTDSGISWTRIEMISSAGYTDVELCAGCAETVEWDEVGDHPTFFTMSYHQPGTLLETFRSLVY
jgi:hypothetical protein